MTGELSVIIVWERKRLTRTVMTMAARLVNTPVPMIYLISVKSMLSVLYQGPVNFFHTQQRAHESTHLGTPGRLRYSKVAIMAAMQMSMKTVVELVRIITHCFVGELC